MESVLIPQYLPICHITPLHISEIRVYLFPITVFLGSVRMNQVATIASAPPGALTLFRDDMDAAGAFLSAEKAAATQRAYRSDFRIFVAYCEARGLAALPAHPDTVMAFLAAEATAGTKASTLGRRVAAIRYAHKAAGHEPPTNRETVKAVMRGIRRTIGAAPDQKAPATSDRITDMVAHCPNTLIGKRDRALLLLGFAGAFRRSELMALTVADLIKVEGGMRVIIRRSKTDQEGQGHEIAIPSGGKLRPVEAVQVWLAAASIAEGPVFRPVAKGGRVAACALSDKSVANIVKAHAARAGLDPSKFSGHSLRSGPLTSAAEAGANVFKMMEVSRHKSVDTLRGYIRRADLFKDHAFSSFL
jgi:site-specific recombinase XerD